MKRISVTQGEEALVEDQDYEYLTQWKWYTAKNGKHCYAVRQIRREDGQQRLVLMHRIVAERAGFLGGRVDHRDRNGLNNQRSNLRVATPAQNSANIGMRVTNTSGAVGVSECRDRRNRKWQAKVLQNGHRSQRYFADFDEAIAWRDAKATELHGEFAFVNGVA
jgi:hypothetical protein